ncbi:hypothetical protein BKA61DRAFT_590359 [Leptodontidium sp. MPI-SDFR-AT-0119]|nr:hypothetical protein BKA61DRAFT_590359 [Leptodontidium sp. MPI-SDFR-AT-0119]
MMLRSSWLVRVWLGGVPLLARASDVVQNCVIDLGSKVPKELGWILARREKLALPGHPFPFPPCHARLDMKKSKILSQETH